MHGTGIGSFSGVSIDDDKNQQWKSSSVYLKNRNKSQIAGFRVSSRDKLPEISSKNYNFN